MTSQILWANDATTTLAAPITNVAVTATLATGSGALFPAPGAGQYFVATFVDTATGLLNEIVHVTNVTGDIVTIVRAQEGTTALNWNANDLFSNLVTAGTMSAFTQYAALAQSIGANGYVTLPGGIIIQWGTDSTNTSPQSITLPIPFPNNFFAFVTTMDLDPIPNVAGYASGVIDSLSQFSIAKSSTHNVFWMAIGN